MRQLAQFADRDLDVSAKVFEQGQHCLGLAVLGDLPGQPQFHGERDQVLLRAVVQVALDRAPRGVGRGDDPQPGRLEFLVALGQLGERGLQGGVQPDVVQRQAQLPGQLDE